MKSPAARKLRTPTQAPSRGAGARPAPAPALLALPRRIVSLGIDPGRSAGVALAVLDPGDTLPRIVGAWSVWTAAGTPDEEWLARMEAALAEAAAAARSLGVEPRDVVAWIERPGSRSSWGRGPNRRRRGEVTVRGVAEIEGLARGAWHRIAGVLPRQVEQVEWCRSWYPAIEAGKRGEGYHRIQEVAGILPGARDALDGLPGATQADRARRVDVAEAMLIAGAAGVVRR